MGTFNLAYEKEEDKSFRYLFWAQALCASKTTLANIVFAHVHEQGMRRNKENLRKISSQRIRPLVYNNFN